jgi:ribosomal-protein-alanine N-acetyltransferase
MDYFNQESERLRFRKLTTDDIPRWLEFFKNNDNLKFLGIDLTKSHETLAEGWILAQFERYETQGLGHLAIEIKETKEFIGLGGILPRALNGRKEYEIAYSLIPRFWKKGFGTEAAKQMKQFGFENIETDRFVSIIDKDNIDSIRVAQKNGMEVLFETEYLGMFVKVFGIEKNL